MFSRNTLLISLCAGIGLSINACSSVPYPCNDPGAGKCGSVTSAYDAAQNQTMMEEDLENGKHLDGAEDQTFSPAYRSTSSNKKGTPNLANQLAAEYLYQNKFPAVPSAGSTLRSAPKTMRIWILPYEDDVGLYHDQQYVFAVLSKGEWKYKSISLMNNTYFGTNQNLVDVSSKFESQPQSNFNPFQPVSRSASVAPSNVMPGANGAGRPPMGVLPGMATPANLLNNNSNVINNVTPNQVQNYNNNIISGAK